MHAQIHRSVLHFHSCVCTSDPGGLELILKFFKDSDNSAYNQFAHVLPVSSRCRLPAAAATVGATVVLREGGFELLPDCAERPGAIPLPKHEWPVKHHPDFHRETVEYDMFCKQALDCGLHEVVPKCDGQP